MLNPKHQKRLLKENPTLNYMRESAQRLNAFAHQWNVAIDEGKVAQGGSLHWSSSDQEEEVSKPLVIA